MTEADFWSLLSEPFMQRALLGGMLTGALGGVLGSFAVLRQLSFFSDALGHSSLLGITLGILLGVNPTLVLIPFAVLFALLVSQLVERSALPTDALLNKSVSSMRLRSWLDTRLRQLAAAQRIQDARSLKSEFLLD